MIFNNIKTSKAEAQAEKYHDYLKTTFFETKQQPKT